MIDSLLINLEKAKKLNYMKKLNLKEKSYALITFHRRSNVDKKEDLEKLIKIINYFGKYIKIFFSNSSKNKKKMLRNINYWKN